MSLPATGCNLTQSIASCATQAPPPSLGDYNAHVVPHAVGDMVGAFFHAGPPAVLALLVALYLLSRVVALGSVLVAGLLARPRKEE